MASTLSSQMSSSPPAADVAFAPPHPPPPPPPPADSVVATAARSSTRVLSSLSRLFFRMATFGYLGSAPVDIGSELSSSAGSLGASQGVGAATSSGAAVAQAEGFRGIGNVFSYVTSRWAVLCILMAMLLNRTLIYASLRRPLRLPVKIRFLMRIVPILLFVWQSWKIMLAMRCQSSSVYRSAEEPPSGGFMYKIGSMGTWWMDDQEVCESIGMIPDEKWISDLVKDAEEGVFGTPIGDETVIDGTEAIQSKKNLSGMMPRGSLELLWPLYKSLCLSQFVEIFSCAITGRSPAAETGMTMLEHSLAFAEAEALATRKSYLVRTGHLQSSISSKDNDGTSKESNEERGVRIQSHKNVHPAVLYIALISSMGHLTSHTLAILNLQSKYRLLSTGLWGIMFLLGFAQALWKNEGLGLFDFPTICVVGFIPHLLIFTGITVCGAIYGLALLLSSLFPPEQRRGGGRPSFKLGFGNLQANLTLSTININLSDDFYTTLLKLGFMCLTAASEATYLNEGRAVRLPGSTWLENERVRLLDTQRVLGGGVATSYIPANWDSDGRGVGPYAMERKDVKGLMVTKGSTRVGDGNTWKWTGVGAMIRGVVIVFVRLGVGILSRLFGIQQTSTAAAPTDGEEGREVGGGVNTGEEEAFAGIDAVEYEGVNNGDEEGEEELGRRLYGRFLKGRLWDDKDESPDFTPDIDDDDDATSTTSTISASSSSSTPTKSHPFATTRRHLSPPLPGRTTRETTPLINIFETPTQLANLLDPQTPEQREEARLMARHLTSDTIITRRRYEELRMDNNRMLLGSGSVRESSTLESILLSRRRRHTHHRESSPSFSSAQKHDETDAVEEEEAETEAGEEGGPQCVVCQSAPRTILVWPCRCLALCEDCRVCLAMNNFGNCVCCRAGLEGFSRIYIP